MAARCSCHLSSHAGHPRPATSDTTQGSQATPADSLKESQLAARSGPSPRRRTSPTRRIETASLRARAQARRSDGTLGGGGGGVSLTVAWAGLGGREGVSFGWVRTATRFGTAVRGPWLSL